MVREQQLGPIHGPVCLAFLRHSSGEDATDQFFVLIVVEMLFVRTIQQRLADAESPLVRPPAHGCALRNSCNLAKAIRGLRQLLF